MRGGGGGEEGLGVKTESGLFGVTPGQTAVFYQVFGFIFIFFFKKK